ncbi:AAA family ATPase [Chryseobacterium sp. VD8]|uniref:AAA family ATPase n=1 Tax=Chryseobacterium sp. VD8 TaxID=3081254 RepID=UPI003016A892
MEKGFKLMAIRPQIYCNKKFLKNLNSGTIYKFFGDYSYYDIKNEEIIDSIKEIHTVKYNSVGPDNLYSSKDHNLNINVSAIVGKNGAGKSSLLELLYVACYIISAKAKIITGVEAIRNAIDSDYYFSKSSLFNSSIISWHHII